MDNRPIEILLVEDNPGDVRLLKEALKGGEVMHNLSVVEDGVEAMAYLRAEDGYMDAPRPDLILLDLNMPKKDGREVLGDIKNDPGLRQIPVVVLTTSHSEQDIFKSYDLHANCYVTKPATLEQFMYTMNAIVDFWLSIVKLPRSQPYGN